jgi:hypothetical protein
MANFDKFPKNGKGGGGDKDDFNIFDAFTRYNEPRCKTCQHPNRELIDRLLAIKTPHVEIERLCSTEENKLDYRSIGNHELRHLKYEDEAIRQIIEHEAGLAQENLETGVKGAFLRRTSLDVAIKKLFDGIISGDIQVEAKDMVKMIELREKLDTNSAQAAVEHYQTQFNAFTEAIREVCPPEIQHQILLKMRQILDIPQNARPALQPPEE